MKKIHGTSIVMRENLLLDEFLKEIEIIVVENQENGFDAEVQYSTCCNNDNILIHSAFIIIRK